MSQQQPKLYTRTKRDEMTFGILPEFVPTDLVGNMKGDARIYSSLEVHDLMMQMDEGFVGMRRSLVDKLENMRQLILYTPIGTIDENDTVRFAVYQRAAGSEARLKDGFSIGFGGHVEREDLHGHYAHNEEGQYVEIPDVPSSFYSTLNSGMRELVHTVDPADVNGNVVPFGFVSDRDMDKPGFVGNTHLGVLAMLRVKSDIDFKVLEEKYTTVGWKTKEELLELPNARWTPVRQQHRKWPSTCPRLSTLSTTRFRVKQHTVMGFGPSPLCRMSASNQSQHNQHPTHQGAYRG